MGFIILQNNQEHPRVFLPLYDTRNLPNTKILEFNSTKEANDFISNLKQKEKYRNIDFKVIHYSDYLKLNSKKQS